MAAWINAVQINHLGKLKNVVHFTTNVVSAMARNGKSFVKFWCAVLKLAFKSINHLYNAALVGAAWQHHPSKRGFVRMAVDFYHWPSFTFIQFCVRFSSICKYFTCWHQVLKLWACCFSLPRIPLLCLISTKFDNIRQVKLKH